MKLKRLGVLDITFAREDAGIYYYHMDVAIGNEKRHIQLPRYHQYIGWIEVFGLPPQNEWVVLDDIESMEAEAALIVDGIHYREHFSYTPNKNKQTHEIIVARSNETIKEITTWFEDYSAYPDVIKNEVSFANKDSEYICEMKKRRVDTDELDGGELTFVEQIVKNYGTPDQIWKKEFTSEGTLPPVYYSIFPISSLIDLTKLKGESIEIGYMHGGKEHIDRVHGDWYKRFVVNGKTFFINEDNYSSKTINRAGQQESIKNTYRKQLFVI